jgi:hypothetical protein
VVNATRIVFLLCVLALGCHAERSAALQVTRAPGRTTERGTCWTEAVLEGVHSLKNQDRGEDPECVYVSVCLSM